jgi:catechol 2,3-dioxygenase-like lactoylglutathione lyase family enzyme
VKSFFRCSQHLGPPDPTSLEGLQFEHVNLDVASSIARMGVVAVGHVGVRAKDLQKSTAFYREIVGLKQIVDLPDVVSIFEVGDADFFILPGEPGSAGFDFAAPDVDDLRASLVAAGVSCTEPRDDPASGHRSFAFTDPDGNRIGVCSAHARAIRPATAAAR